MRLTIFKLHVSVYSTKWVNKTAFGVFGHWRAVQLERASGTGSYLYLNSCRARLLAVKLRSLRFVSVLYNMHIHVGIDIPEAFVTFGRTLWTSELIYCY